MTIHQSAMDGVIVMDVDSEECIRRSQFRKIDPTTGNIYHLQDNPPPENDAKLKDRLQDYNDPEAEPNKMNHNHGLYNENEPNLKRWISTFGLKDE